MIGHQQKVAYMPAIDFGGTAPNFSKDFECRRIIQTAPTIERNDSQKNNRLIGKWPQMGQAAMQGHGLSLNTQQKWKQAMGGDKPTRRGRRFPSYNADGDLILVEPRRPRRGRIAGRSDVFSKRPCQPWARVR